MQAARGLFRDQPADGQLIIHTRAEKLTKSLGREGYLKGKNADQGGEEVTKGTYHKNSGNSQPIIQSVMWETSCTHIFLKNVILLNHSSCGQLVPGTSWPTFLAQL